MTTLADTPAFLFADRLLRSLGLEGCQRLLEVLELPDDARRAMVAGAEERPVSRAFVEVLKNVERDRTGRTRLRTIYVLREWVPASSWLDDLAG